ncbi:hypothetical protein [Saccharopolyspora griseoalba]|uniref:Uncharacterized protein n=1 Tax=Saccharopolyspora griseoalba TaxID=1431848 RepID=A0ABW2LK83_9PSEU
MEKRERSDYERGLPGYHDPLAGFGGAPYARSALTLRLVLAGFGFAFSLVVGILILVWMPEGAWLGWVLLGVAVLAAANFAWVAHRKRRGEPG